MRHYLAYLMRGQCFTNWNSTSVFDMEFKFPFVFRDQVIQCGRTCRCGLRIEMLHRSSITARNWYRIGQATPVHPVLVASIWNYKLFQEVPWDEMLFSTGHESIYPKKRAISFANTIRVSGRSSRPVRLWSFDDAMSHPQRRSATRPPCSWSKGRQFRDTGPLRAGCGHRMSPADTGQVRHMCPSDHRQGNRRRSRG